MLDFEGETNHAIDDHYPSHGGAGVSIEVIDSFDGGGPNGMTTTLRVEKFPGSEFWAGVELASGYTGTNLIGDGSQPIEMRFFSENYGGSVTLELRSSGGAHSYSETFPVHEGWNFVNFHVEPADDAINWSDLQFRPDFDPNDPNPTANVSVYYIDHVHLPQATLLAESSIPASADFLAGPVAPDGYARSGGVPVQ